MNKVSKIFLGIIIVLIIALGIMTYLYFDMRKIAKRNLDAYVEAATAIYDMALEKQSQNTSTEQVNQ